MKVLIVSDTHGIITNYRKVLQLHNPDLLIHCGDVDGQEDLILECADCPVKMVSGNNDFFSDLPRELEFNVGPLKVWVCHGHNYYVNMSSEFIREEASARGMDVVMFGHTHRPEVRRDGGLTSVNPGSLSYPRQEGRKPSYVIMEDDRMGDWHYTIAYLDT